MTRISVVIPNSGQTSLPLTVESLIDSEVHPFEVLICDDSKSKRSSVDAVPLSPGVSIIRGEENQIQAKRTGARAAGGDYVLFLDSDQTVHPKLLGELAATSSISALVPERVRGRNPLALYEDERKRLAFARFVAHPSIDQPVAPRYYRRAELLASFELLESMVPIEELWQHEDSALFWAFATRARRPLAEVTHLSHYPIFNRSQDVLTTIRKAGNYGVNRGRFQRLAHRRQQEGTEELLRILGRIDLWRPPVDPAGRVELRALLYDLLRATPYMLGYVWGEARS